ncbi:hypothetical protein D046_2708B, partial [Vibrio parahaemolyticus V-223/04]
LGFLQASHLCIITDAVKSVKKRPLRWPLSL